MKKQKLKKQKFKLFKLLISLLMPLGVGLLGSIFAGNFVSSWYSNLIKPSFNPPQWVFAPVWTVLYILIGLSFYALWTNNHPRKFKTLSRVYFVQLGLNGLWSLLFFGFQNPLLAFIDIILLWIFILIFIWKSYTLSKISAYLFIPYWLWVSFALILNLSIIVLNR